MEKIRLAKLEKIRLASRKIENIIQEMDIPPVTEISILFSRIFSIYFNANCNWKGLQYDCNKLVDMLRNYKNLKVTHIDLGESNLNEIQSPKKKIKMKS